MTPWIPHHQPLSLECQSYSSKLPLKVVCVESAPRVCKQVILDHFRAGPIQERVHGVLCWQHKARGLAPVHYNTEMVSGAELQCIWHIQYDRETLAHDTWSLSPTTTLQASSHLCMPGLLRKGCRAHSVTKQNDCLSEGMKRVLSGTDLASRKARTWSEKSLICLAKDSLASESLSRSMSSSQSRYSAGRPSMCLRSSGCFDWFR